MTGRRRGQQPFQIIPAIVDGVEDLAIASLHLYRLQNHELRAELHQSLGIARRVLEIDDDCVVRIKRISFHIRGAAQHLVGAGLAPIHSSGIRGALLNDQFNDARLTGLDSRQSDKQAGQCDRDVLCTHDPLLLVYKI